MCLCSVRMHIIITIYHLCRRFLRFIFRRCFNNTRQEINEFENGKGLVRTFDFTVNIHTVCDAAYT